MKKSELKAVIRSIIREGDHEDVMTSKEKSAVKKIYSEFSAEMKKKIANVISTSRDPDSYSTKEWVNMYKDDVKRMSQMTKCTTFSELNALLSKWYNRKDTSHLNHFVSDHMDRAVLNGKIEWTGED